MGGLIRVIGAVVTSTVGERRPELSRLVWPRVTRKQWARGGAAVANMPTQKGLGWQGVHGFGHHHLPLGGLRSRLFTRGVRGRGVPRSPYPRTCIGRLLGAAPKAPTREDRRNVLCWWMDSPDRKKVNPAALQGRPSRWSRVRRGVRGPLPHLARCGSPRFFGFPMRNQEGDRRGSNPRPSESQSDMGRLRPLVQVTSTV